MSPVYGRDLDLNLLRVFVVVAETGSVTEAARRLLLTQSAISAALKRLATAVDAPLFARSGRNLVLTTRGERLLAAAVPCLDTLLHAALTPATFDPRQSERAIRLGLSDKSEVGLLPPLLRALAVDAPKMKIIAIPAHIRTAGDLLVADRVDLAIGHLRVVPPGVERRLLYRDSLVCLFDPAHARLRKNATRAHYLAAEHVGVSYDGTLRGLVEQMFAVERNVRVSVASVHSVGPIVDGSALVATLPGVVARQIREQRPHLRIVPAPFPVDSISVDLLSRRALADDEAVCFVAERIVAVATRLAKAASRAA